MQLVTSTTPHYVVIPDGIDQAAGDPWRSSTDGRADFAFLAASTTRVSFSAMVLAPISGDDSFHVSVDDGSKQDWGCGESPEWEWKAINVKFVVGPGEHQLKFWHRDDNTKLSQVRIDSGFATFIEGKGDYIGMAPQESSYQNLVTCPFTQCLPSCLCIDFCAHMLRRMVCLR